ncbi:hypothetical protein GCM10010294_44050 [Streptomyces griseoloalbus]|nr:hypothetical protein GCM10010294_44050 [Streptomyces griseoloalbus]
MLLVGVLLPVNRTAADCPFCSGKRKRRGVNVQDLADGIGRLLCARRGAARALAGLERGGDRSAGPAGGRAVRGERSESQ